MHFDSTPVFDDGKEFLVGFVLCRLRGQISGVLLQERTQPPSSVPLWSMTVLAILVKERFAGLGLLLLSQSREDGQQAHGGKDDDGPDG